MEITRKAQVRVCPVSSKPVCSKQNRELKSIPTCSTSARVLLRIRGPRTDAEKTNRPTLSLNWTLDEPQGVPNPPHHHLSSAPNRDSQNELTPSRCRSLSGLSSIMYF